MQQGVKCKRTQLSINVTLRPFAWGLSHTGVLQIPTQYLSDKIKKVVQQANSELLFSFSNFTRQLCYQRKV